MVLFKIVKLIMHNADYCEKVFTVGNIGPFNENIISMVQVEQKKGTWEMVHVHVPLQQPAVLA